MTEGFIAKSMCGAEHGSLRRASHGARLPGLQVAPAAALVLAATLISPAQAQIAPPQQRFQVDPGAVVDDPGRVFGDDADRFLPLAIVGALGLRPFASMTVEYSDNVARARDGVPIAPRFRSKDDWIFRPNGGLGFERSVGRAALFGNASVGRVIYSKNTQLNSNRFGFSGGASVQLGQACSTQIRGAWSQRDAQLGLFEEVSPTEQQRTSFGATVACSTQSGIAGSVGYNRSSVRNSTVEGSSIDRSFANVDSEIVSGNLGYRVGLRGQVGVSASFAENVYPNQLVGGIENSNKIRSVAGYASYRIGNSLNATASIGQTNLTSNIPGSSTFKGVNWNLGLGYAGPRIGANISAGQGINGGRGTAANYAIQRYFNASTTYRANDKLRFATGYAYSNADFRGVTSIPETEIASSNKDNRFFVGSDYRFNRMLSVGVDFNHQRRSSQPANFGYKVNSVIFSARANF